MKDKRKNVILVIGASGVGKTTVCKFLTEQSISIKFKHIDLDDYFRRFKKMKVTEYFVKVGYKRFWEESYRYIKRHYDRHIARNKVDSETTLLIDIGAGSIFDHKSIRLTDEFFTLLLTADPEYLFEREKCKNNHKELGYFKFMEFSRERENLYKNCDIKVDVSYLDVKQVADVVYNKIWNFKRGQFY